MLTSSVAFLTSQLLSQVTLPNPFMSLSLGHPSFLSAHVSEAPDKEIRDAKELILSFHGIRNLGPTSEDLCLTAQTQIAFPSTKRPGATPKYFLVLFYITSLHCTT